MSSRVMSGGFPGVVPSQHIWKTSNPLRLLDIYNYHVTCGGLYC